MDEPTWLLDEYSLKPLTPPPHHGTDPEELGNQDYALAITGDVFRWMINHAPLETVQRVTFRVSYAYSADLMRSV
jgi:cation-transporting ATPase 13A2